MDIFSKTLFLKWEIDIEWKYINNRSRIFYGCNTFFTPNVARKWKSKCLSPISRNLRQFWKFHPDSNITLENEEMPGKMRTYGNPTHTVVKTFIKSLWWARMPADHTWHTIIGAIEMKWNEMNEEYREMVEWNLWQRRMGETLRKTYPDSVSSTTKHT